MTMPTAVHASSSSAQPAAATDAATATASSSSTSSTSFGQPIPIAIGPDQAPLWRVTAAVDPNTTPLELMPVWAVHIDPRKSANFIRFSHSIARRLRTAEQGGDGGARSSVRARNGSTLVRKKSNGQDGYTRHAGVGGREDDADDELDDEDEGEDLDDDDDGSDDDEGEEDEAMKHLRLFRRIDEGQALNALICRVQDLPTEKDVVALLKTADLVPDNTEPKPFEVQVPRFPAPSRDRLLEWKAFWPVSIKYGKSVHALVQPSLSGANQITSSSAAPGVVDRAADARMWNPTATAWAIGNFQKCLRMAWEARERGELPIGVHVTSSYPDGDKIVSGVIEGQTSIEVDAWDTRRSERNPIKHAVTNAIRDVAKVRSERDWERLLVLNAKVANLHRDPHADPDVHRQAMQKAEAAAAITANNAAAAAAASATASATLASASGNGSPSSTTSSAAGRMSNGQDYLLNNLILFTTHEPCVSCCMALVHSRVRAVFFIQPSPRAGGCCGSGLPDETRRCAFANDGGPYAVQEQAGLNHRFDVWRWVGEDADLSSHDMTPSTDVGDEKSSVLSADSSWLLKDVRLDIRGLDA